MFEKPSSDLLAASLAVRARAAGLVADIHTLAYNPRPGKVRFAQAIQDQHHVVVRNLPHTRSVVVIEDKRRTDVPIVLVTATMHGEEIAGALTVYHRFEEMVRIAEEAGVALLCFPLVNPSGFDSGERYGMDGAPDGNNDYLRYKTFDGRWVWDLRHDHSVMEWRWSSDPSLPFVVPLPIETCFMHTRLQSIDWSRVAAAIDLHQDRLSPDVGPGAYHYAFGDLARYEVIVSRIAERVPILSDRDFGVDPNDLANVMRSDAWGFIERHDGGLSDLWDRLGIPHAITAETTGATPIGDAIEVNLEWFRGLCRLASPYRP